MSRPTRSLSNSINAGCAKPTLRAGDTLSYPPTGATVALPDGRIYEFAFPVPRETPSMLSTSKLSTFKPLPAPPDRAVQTRILG
jgi:hypothetical protein